MSDSKLTDLRNCLKKLKVSGFVVPSVDEFQNEYSPPHARRLEWLTGFSGSTAIAVVLENKAAFFTDGRYTLQAKSEIGKDYEQYDIADKSPVQWVKENLKKGKLLLDPWLHSKTSYDNFANVAEIAIAKKNPIDGLWNNRPEPVSDPIKALPLKYSGQKLSDKISVILKKMNEYKADALIIAAPDSLCWLLNIRGNDVPCSPLILSYAILYKNGKLQLFIDKKRINDAVDKHLGSDVKISSPDSLKGCVNDLKNKRTLIDPAAASYWFSANLKKQNIIYAPDPCQMPKACKNKVEIAGSYDAHKIDGAAVTRFLFWLDNIVGKEQVTELSASRKLYNLRKEARDFKQSSFDTIAGFAGNGAIVHYRSSEATNKELKPDGIFLLDSGGQYLSGTTDITRTIAIGKPTKEQKHNFTLVLKGHIALASAIFPKGTSGSQLDILARQHLWSQGLDFDHGTGHGVGSYLNVHEGPQRISKMPNNIALQPGMIVSNEPGYYKTDEYGIRIENLIVVVEKKGFGEGKREFYGFETVTRAPIDLTLVEYSLLNETEKKWLSTYQKLVLNDIKGILGKDEIKWFEKRFLI